VNSGAENLPDWIHEAVNEIIAERTSERAGKALYFYLFYQSEDPIVRDIVLDTSNSFLVQGYSIDPNTLWFAARTFAGMGEPSDPRLEGGFAMIAEMALNPVDSHGRKMLSVIVELDPVISARPVIAALGSDVKRVQSTALRGIAKYLKKRPRTCERSFEEQLVSVLMQSVIPREGVSAGTSNKKKMFQIAIGLKSLEYADQLLRAWAASPLVSKSERTFLIESAELVASGVPYEKVLAARQDAAPWN
jgi:hypothetical protein